MLFRSDRRLYLPYLTIPPLHLQSSYYSTTVWYTSTRSLLYSSANLHLSHPDPTTIQYLLYLTIYGTDSSNPQKKTPLQHLHLTKSTRSVPPARHPSQHIPAYPLPPSHPSSTSLPPSFPSNNLHICTTLHYLHYTLTILHYSTT